MHLLLLDLWQKLSTEPLSFDPPPGLYLDVTLNNADVSSPSIGTICVPRTI